MSASDISEELRAWVRAEIDAQCFGEDFGFDVIPQAAVTEQGPAVQYVIIVTMRSPLLGQPPLLHVAGVQAPRPARDDIRQVATAALQGLRAVSARVMNGAGGQPGSG
jgi:hypothetical protein